ncbi:ABC transporter permease [Stigmatella sp. ncwal1]|uniref:ABC transporter permease n=1 Tax=Stigmatella ashevillensis TaxID=2995309 RepID=A0ABT5D5N5_9BACT|nr:putative ABC exporter domain-containing protein [Stigmatella ashevillena]MDC0708971.1 ABC transporter permease [Stigmatella ashevillena]
MSFPRAVAFLWWASLRNRVRKQVERLRRPKYLLGLVAGGIYLYSFFLRRLNFGARSEALTPEAHSLAEFSLAGMMMVTLVSAWALGQDRPAVTFSEMEIQQLFPAPISRRALVHYKLARGVFGAAVGAFFSTFFMGRLVSPSPVLFFLGALVTFVTVNLHVVAVSFLRTRLARWGWRGAALRWTVFAGLLGALGLSVYSAVQAHPFPEEVIREKQVWEWLSAVLEGSALQAVLWPGRLLVALPMAASVSAFLHELPLALGLLGVHYLGVLALIVPFEEVVVARAEEVSLQRGQRLARVGHIVLRAPFFRLKPSGRPEVALLWKNLIAARRMGGVDILFSLALIGLLVPLGVAIFLPHALPGVRQMVASVYLGVAALLTFIGPGSFRSDLRMDLPKLDLLRAMPLTGRQVVAAELLAPGLLLAVMQIGLLALALVLAGDMSGRWSSEFLLAAGLGLMPLLPAVSLGGLFVQNAAVVLFPAWLPADGERARGGIEALGQRLLMLAGSLVVLLGGLLPAAILAALVGFTLEVWLGVWALPVAGLTAAGGLALEIWLGVMALGRAFDRMDVSSEGPGAP